jgi:PadR family transcriptional regulator, regulatory protein PadR
MKDSFLENWQSQLKKGLLPVYVLDIISRKECYGYELIQDIRNIYQVDIAEGTLYPLLVRLMKDELLTHKWVEQASGIPRKYYTLSEFGSKCLEEMKSAIGQELSKINK